MNDIDDAIKEFLVESFENMDQLDRDLVALEKDPSSRDILARIFRTIHTIKGTCGFLAFSRLEKVAHAGENLLSRLRDGDLRLNPEITSALLAMVDAVRQMLSSIEANGTDGDGEYGALIASLARLQVPGASPAPPPAPVASPRPRSGSPRPRSAPPTPRLTIPPTHPAVAQAMEPRGAAPGPSAGPAPGPLPGPATLPTSAPSPAAHDPAYSTNNPHSTRSPSGTLPPLNTLAPQSSNPRGGSGRQQTDTHQRALTPGGDNSGQIADSTIRVDVVLLDKLMNLVGELVLARNQILQFTATQREKDTAFVATSQRLNLITTELQEGVMKTRMQPIGNIWGKFPRVVRDLAMVCGKQVRIEMEGKNTELDKTIIEAIKDPLTHLIRNAVDHGVERPEVRTANKKPPAGRLFLRAFHEGGQVNIEISDDGAGIDPERIKQKALQRGLITADQAARMSDRDAVGLIFLPGFSTAEQVTNVSGRGVGMDVVKTNIEKIGGTVDAQSRIGHGTTFKIKIPLTLAIIPALIVTSGGDRYAIPQVSLLELVRLEGERCRRGIEVIHGAPVYRLRGNLLPVLYLSRELMVEDKTAQPDTVNIVVLQAGDRQFGLVVEGISDTEEIVVKPLSQQLKGIPCFAGATIMGDGRVALILDVLGTAQRAGVVTEVRDRNLMDQAAKAEDTSDKRQTLLLFKSQDEERMAIPLSMVARLEEFPRTALERVGTQDVVQYRDQILPLIHLAAVLPSGRASWHERTERPQSDTIHVVVYSDNRRSIGLVVERILDIVEESLAVRLPSSRTGVLSSAVIQGRVTELLDVEGVIHTAAPGFFARGGANEGL